MTNSMWILIALVAGTMITRFIPFVIFPAGKETPKFVEYLGQKLPYASMGLLVVYCLKGVHITSGTHGIPELIAVAATAGIHIWKKNVLLSISVGTILYMLLVQLVFPV